MRSFLALFLLGLLSVPTIAFSQSASLDGFSPENSAAQIALEAQLLKLPQAETFKNHLRALTISPHRAGTDGGRRVIEYLITQMEDAGLSVDTYDYDIYIPPAPGIARAELVKPIRLPLNSQEYILPEDAFSGMENVSPGWNAFSGSGEVTAEVVYVNYGTREDFARLAEMGIAVEGKIVIARYGQNFRGYKAKYAAAAGAVGLIIYSDPKDNGYVRGLPYPDGPFASTSTIQRGSLLTLDYEGDPLTPFEPALPGEKTVRLNPDDLEGLHRIPVMPLPYGSAQEILSRMTGIPVPANWQGGLPFTYRLEGGSELAVHLVVDQPRELVRVTNVVGKITGVSYPDEWIIMGCHHDAWDFGAVDPNSGTASLLTLADAFGEMLKTGWRPRRSILFGHWDAEEFGIIGSTEWVEQLKEELTLGGVAYLNADGAISGSRFWASSSPSLKAPLVEASKVVPYPGSGGSLYEQWMKNSDAAEPPVGNLGGGSDHVGFYSHIGIPSLGAGFSGANGIYHSAYDNFAWYEQYGDTAFVFGPTLAKLYGVLSLRLANADILPYDLSRYGQDLNTHLENTETEIQEYAPEVSLISLLRATDELGPVATGLEARIQECLMNNRIKKKSLKEINEKLIALEKSFIDSAGMDFGAWYRSLYAAPDPYSGYAAWMLPGLRYEASLESTQKLASWERRYLNALQNLRRKMEMLTAELE